MWRDTKGKSLVGESNYSLEIFFGVEFDHLFTPSVRLSSVIPYDAFNNFRNKDNQLGNLSLLCTITPKM